MNRRNKRKIIRGIEIALALGLGVLAIGIVFILGFGLSTLIFPDIGAPLAGGELPPLSEYSPIADYGETSGDYNAGDTEISYPVYEENYAEDEYYSEEYYEEPVIESAFSIFPFYLPQNAETYALFQEERPDLDAETVVWMVNVGLHLPFYYEIHINYDENPLLVNPTFRLPYGFSPQGMVPVNNENCNFRGTPEAVAAFRSLRRASQAAGFDISAVSVYRSAARQEQLFDRQGRRDGAVARPHHSEHQTGRAIDLWGPGPSGLMDANESTPVGRWVRENAHYHGFILRYLEETTHITGFIYEPWHITYVGIDISMHMHENNILSLEEFVGRNPGATMGWGG